MSALYDNIAFSLREHTKKTQQEIRRIVLAKPGSQPSLAAVSRRP